MTLEGPAQGPDETPAPPARTRWSEEPADDDPGLMPPYVPGGARAGSGAAAPAPEPPPPAEATWEPEGAGHALPQDDEPFPFEQPMESPSAASSAPAAEPLPLESESTDDDFPFDAFDIEGGEGEGTFPPEPLPTLEEPPSSRTAELAERLRGLAEALRRDGVPALERQMASSDRFEALVAGVIAGYLAGLGE